MGVILRAVATGGNEKEASPSSRTYGGISGRGIVRVYGAQVPQIRLPS